MHRPTHGLALLLAIGCPTLVLAAPAATCQNIAPAASDGRTGRVQAGALLPFPTEWSHLLPATLQGLDPAGLPPGILHGLRESRAETRFPKPVSSPSAGKGGGHGLHSRMDFATAESCHGRDLYYVTTDRVVAVKSCEIRVELVAGWRPGASRPAWLLADGVLHFTLTGPAPLTTGFIVSASEMPSRVDVSSRRTDPMPDAASYRFHDLVVDGERLTLAMELALVTEGDFPAASGLVLTLSRDGEPSCASTSFLPTHWTAGD